MPTYHYSAHIYIKGGMAPHCWTRSSGQQLQFHIVTVI